MKMLPRNLIRGSVFIGLSQAAFFLASCSPSTTPLPCSTLSVTVTKTADTNDGICSAADCSLREAVIFTNTCPGQQEVRIPAGTYTLTIAGASEDAAATGDLDVTDETIFTGIDNPVIDGNQLDRVFQIHGHPAYATMLDLTIQNGRAKEGAGILNTGTLMLMQGVTVRNNTAVATPGTGSSHGGGILSEGYGVLNVSESLISGNSADQGGGIVVLANLMFGAITPGGGIWDSVVSANTAAGSGGGLALEQTVGVDGFIISRSKVTGNRAGADGGGAQNFGKLLLYQSTVEDNFAGGNGGGVFNSEDGLVTSSESAITANHALSGGGLYNEGRAVFAQSLLNGNLASGQGGAIFGTGVVGKVDLDHSTVSGNQATQGGAAQIVNGKLEVTYSTIAENTIDGVHFTMGTVWFQNTILDRNGTDNCSGLIPSSSGYNIDDGNTCSFSHAGDLPNTDPLLDPLAANGGLTLTHALDAASPAIDSAAPATCSGTDQRGVVRPQGPGCDRGAFEREAPPSAPATISGLVWHDLCAVPEHGYPPTPPPGCADPDGDGFYIDANGILEPGEPGIPGVTLHLKAGTCAAGADLATAVTDAAGLYSFSGLAAGTYCISINPIADGNDAVLIPGGWTYPSAGSAVVQTEITLAAGEIHPDVNFGWDYQFLPMMPDYLTPTPTPAALSFINPRISTEHVYYSPSFSNRHCGPTEVEFRVGLSSLKGVANVLLFVRLKEQSSGLLGEWADGIPMSSTGDGQFLATVYAENIPGAQTFGESWVQYQFVALNAGGEAIVHSEVFWNLAFSPCGTRG
jgi:CSLREA domain-containing protein